MTMRPRPRLSGWSWITVTTTTASERGTAVSARPGMMAEMLWKWIRRPGSPAAFGRALIGGAGHRILNVLRMAAQAEAPSQRRLADGQLLAEIIDSHTSSGGTYGRRGYARCCAVTASRPAVNEWNG